MIRVNAASLVESARVGADSLRSNPLRTVLATTGVIIGVGSLVAAFAITDGVELWARALIARESSVQDVVVTARTREQVRGRSVAVHGYPVFTVDDAERAGAEVPGVMRHALTLNGRAETEFLGSRATVQLTLATASLADFAGLQLAGGRFFTRSEENRGASVVVLGHRTAMELAGVHDALWLLGRTIRIGGDRREVLGVLAPPAGGDEPDMIAFAPLRGGETLLETGAPPAPTLRLKARSIDAVDTLRSEVVNWLAERYGRRMEKLDVAVGTERLENTRQAMLLSKLLLGLLASLILAVGGIGIMNVLLAAVVERTREIGIRKAVGASRRDIQTQFLVESVTVTTAGSAIGFAGGLVLAYAGTAVFRRITGAGIFPVVHLSTPLIAIGAAVVVGVVFGTYPARRAANLSPIEAIARE